jgi:hypothetical protein
MLSRKPTRFIAAGALVVAVAVGGYAIGNSSSGNDASSTANAAPAGQSGRTVNRVLQLSDGSYAVHRIGTAAPHHIFVSKDFRVTGTA